jgi:cyclopropane-fatty-acyl-phospholipid synthase
MTEAPRDRRAATAVRLLERVFAPVPTPLVFRLWDGTTARVGARGECGFEVVFRSRPIFRRILRRPTALSFGEAFIDGEIDIEGDMFAAMRAATDVDAMQVGLGMRLAVLVGSFRV